MEGIIENPLDPSSRKQQITSSTWNGTICLCRRPRHATTHPSPPLPSLILYALYCFPDFASTDFASALLLSGLRVRFTAFRTSRPLYCFPDFASTLLLSGLRVHGLRIHIYCFPDSAYTFTAFRTPRPHLLLSELRAADFPSTFTTFRTSRPLYCFPRALAHHLPLHILQIPIMLLSYDRKGELPRRMTTRRSLEPKRDASHDLWLPPLIEHATKEGQAVSTPFWPTGFPHEDS
ncbi:hypothetical protein CDL15_Pgr024834 [Punica granatum]|uniref:Uncharacterized protein n=1 Tax=Punica granatum TaxID=22663 RepID=A0A218WL73_PUNGR|nr:hypothetical protein CDL15_Pgr024834 [Punica granatum]